MNGYSVFRPTVTAQTVCSTSLLPLIPSVLPAYYSYVSPHFYYQRITVTNYPLGSTNVLQLPRAYPLFPTNVSELPPTPSSLPTYYNYLPTYLIYQRTAVTSSPPLFFQRVTVTTCPLCSTNVLQLPPSLDIIHSS